MDSPLRNIKLVLQYDGARYCGWQRQLNALSVQQVVEEALLPVVGQLVSVKAAGRTDAGVHAAGQVANFQTLSPHSPDVLLRAGNARLPRDVVIREACEVPLSFNARRDARERWYQYRLATGAIRPGFDRDRLWHVTDPLDAALAPQAAAMFAGSHDFSGFRSSHCTAKRTLLDVTQCALTIEGERWTLDVRCRSFLHNMMRILTGAIVDVARGRLSLADLQTALETGERNPRFLTCPPHGLTLMEVKYD